MRRRAWAWALLCGALACGPRFESEQEELVYLQSLARPSAEQARRREELSAKLLAEFPGAQRKETPEERAVRERRAAEAAEEQLATLVATRMGWGRESEKKGDYEAAARRYEEVLAKFPDRPEAREAAERLKACREKLDAK